MTQAEEEVTEIETEEFESEEEETELETEESENEEVVEESEDESDTEQEDEAEESEDDSKSEENEEDEFSVTLEEDSPPQDDEGQASWIKNVRRKYREAQKENKELKKRLEVVESAEKRPAELPKKPTIEDFDYDSDEFENALDEWYSKKREFDDYQAKIEQEQRKEQESWQERLNEYDKRKKSLSVKDFDSAEEFVSETVSESQLAIILKSAKDPATMIYALGKNHGKLTELSNITDPLEFAAEIGRLETKMKVNKPRKPPAPEKKVSKGTASLSGTVDKTLERLEAEADRTGDRTKVVQYKRSQKKA